MKRPLLALALLAGTALSAPAFAGQARPVRPATQAP